MNSLSLQEIETHPDTDAIMEALAGADDGMEWTHLFSAYGKHAITVRKDPAASE